MNMECLVASFLRKIPKEASFSATKGLKAASTHAKVPAGCNDRFTHESLLEGSVVEIELSPSEASIKPAFSIALVAKITCKGVRFIFEKNIISSFQNVERTRLGV